MARDNAAQPKKPKHCPRSSQTINIPSQLSAPAFSAQLLAFSQVEELLSAAVAVVPEGAERGRARWVSEKVDLAQQLVGLRGN